MKPTERAATMDQSGRDERRVYVGELRAYKAALDRHAAGASEESSAALDDALAVLVARIGEDQLEGVRELILKFGDELLDRLEDSSFPAGGDPEPTEFEEALQEAEDEEIALACVRLGVDEDTTTTILHALAKSRDEGRDQLAEHGQDAEALVRKHLGLLDEARRTGRSRNY